MKSAPDERGYFGDYGGKYVAETLINPLFELEQAYKEATKDPVFQQEIRDTLKHYVGRPSALYFAKRWSEMLGGAKVYFKREDLNHTGAHKINNTVGQILLAKRMGKTRLIAETGAGQHGVASATIAARLGLECVVYMGSTDVVRQATNVYRMEMLGAKVVAVDSGTKTLKDALNEALRDWVKNVDDTFYVIGTVAGPHPYPVMVRDFQKIIGEELKQQMPETGHARPDAIVACVGGGSNAIGIFHAFIADEHVKMYGVEAGGLGLATGAHAAPLCAGKPGILHGNNSYLMADDDGQVLSTESISAGLDYPGVGPEHSWLKDSNRVHYTYATDDEVVEAFHEVTRTEGIIPALESAHALAYTRKLAPTMSSDQSIVVCMSGRGDKDLTTMRSLQDKASNS